MVNFNENVDEDHEERESDSESADEYDLPEVTFQLSSSCIQMKTLD